MAGQVNNDWLRTFHDIQLDTVVSEAIANNLDLRQSAQRVEQARQTVIVVGAHLKPQIAANFGGAATVTSPEKSRTGTNMEYGVVGWEIDIWGKLRARVTKPQRLITPSLANRWLRLPQTAGIRPSKRASCSHWHRKM